MNWFLLTPTTSILCEIYVCRNKFQNKLQMLNTLVAVLCAYLVLFSKLSKLGGDLKEVIKEEHKKFKDILKNIMIKLLYEDNE